MTQHLGFFILWLCDCVLCWMQWMRKRLTMWLNAGAPDGLVEVRAYDLHEMRRVVLFQMTMVIRLLHMFRPLLAEDVFAICLRMLRRYCSSNRRLVFVGIFRSGHVMGDNLESVMGDQLVPAASYKVATVAPYIDVSYTYNTTIRGCCDRCRLTPADLLLLAYLDGRVPLEKVLRFVSSAFVTLDVLSLETMESTLTKAGDCILEAH